RVDAAGGDPDVLAAVRIDAVRVPVHDGDPDDVDRVAAEQAHVVVARVRDGHVAKLDLPAFLEGDGLRSVATRPVAVDPAGAEDADVLQALPLEEGEAEAGGLRVRERLVAELLDRIEVGVVGAGHQGRAGRQLHGDAAAEADGAGAVGAGREVDGAPGGGRGVDGGLDG